MEFWGSSADRPFIYEIPQDVTVVEGENVTLVCKINTPTVGCVWKKGNNVMNFKIDNDKRIRYLVGDSGQPGDCSLLIIDVRLEDDYGMWSCQPLVRSQIIDLKTAQVTVFAKPWDPILEFKGETLNNNQLVSPPASDNYQNVVLSCTSHMANPDVDHEWTLNGKKISSSSQGIYPDVRRFTTVTVSTLDVTMHPESDPLNISCWAKHPTYRDNGIREISVVVMPQPYPVLFVYIYSGCPSYKINNEGAFYLPKDGRLSFICVAKGYPKPIFEWEQERNGKWNLITQNVFGNILIVDQLGVYRCSARNEILDILHSDSVKVVKAKDELLPRSFPKFPVTFNDFLVQPMDVHGLSGHPIILDCIFASSVEECFWYKDGIRINLNSKRIKLISKKPTEGDCSIRFNNPQMQDAGQWLCEGTLSSLSQTIHSQQAKVTILGPPAVPHIVVEGKGLFLGQRAYVQAVLGEKKMVPVTCSYQSNSEKYKIDWILNAKSQYSIHTRLLPLSNGLFNISSVLTIEVEITNSLIKQQEIEVKCIVRKIDSYLDSEIFVTEARVAIEYATNKVRIYPCCLMALRQKKSTHLFCDANGFAGPVIRWQRLVNDTWSWIKMNKLSRPWIKVRTIGYYRCLAGNYLNPSLVPSNSVYIARHDNKIQKNCQILVIRNIIPCSSSIMALLIAYILPAVLIVISTTIVSSQSVFELEPNSTLVTYGKKVVIPCKINEIATSCLWIHNHKEKVVLAGSNYELIKNGLADVSHNLPSNPRLQVNSFPAITSVFKVVIDPTQPDVTISCSSKDSYPLFKEYGSLLVYVNNTLQDVNGTLTSSVAKPETNDINVDIKLKLDGDTVVKCVVNHEFLPKSKELIVTFVHPDSKFSLSKRGVKLMSESDKEMVEFPVPNQFGLSSRLELTWYQKSEGETDWSEITNVKGKLKNEEVKALPKPGTYHIKAELKQKTYFNAPLESLESTVLTYVPMTKVSIVSPLSVKLKVGDQKVLTCEADGDPKPQLYWLKATHNSIDVVHEGPLYIVGVSASQAGYYKCDAVQKILQQEVVISSYGAVKVSSRGARTRIILVSGCIIGVLLAGIVGLIWVFSRSTEKPCDLEKSKESKELSTHQYDDLVVAGLKPQLSSGKKRQFVVQKKIVRLENEKNEMKTCECVGEPPILQLPLERYWYVADQIAIYTCPLTENKTVAIANCNMQHCTWEVKFVSSCPILEKECIDEPPKLDIAIIGDDWDGQIKFIDTKVHYYCLNDPTLLIQIAVCTENLTWSFVYSHNNSMNCSCDKFPPFPEGQNIQVNWNESKIYGSIATYTCVGYKVIQTAVCTSTSGWVLQNNSSWKELFEENCECSNDFPTFNLTFDIKWSAKLKLIGNVITYFCYENSTAVYMKMMCSMTKEWEIIFLQPCECVADPPEFKLPVFRQWVSGSKAINTKVQYYCSEEVNAILFQVAKCNDSRIWHTIRLQSCECLEDPPNNHFYLSKNVNQIDRYVGSTRIYYCLPDLKYGISHLMKCCGNLTWINFMTYSCECLTAPPVLNADEYQTWSGVLKSYVNSSVFYHCNSDKSSAIFQVALCNVKRQWSMQHKETAINLKMKFCKCETPPPMELFGYQRHWNSSLNQIGSEVYYSCTGNTTTVLTGVCSADQKWKLPARLDNNLLVTVNCVCPELDSDANVVTWTGIKNRIGSVASIWCLQNNSQLHQQLKCRDDKKWKELYRDVCRYVVTSTSVTSTEITSTLLPEVVFSTVTSTDENEFVLEIKEAENKSGNINQVKEDFGSQTSINDMIIEDVLLTTEFSLFTDNKNLNTGTSLINNVTNVSSKFNYKKRDDKRLKNMKQQHESKSNVPPVLVLQQIRRDMERNNGFNLANNTIIESGSWKNSLSLMMAVFENVLLCIRSGRFDFTKYNYMTNIKQATTN
uniref:Ig-like domain-containing protein n=1 Tax=Strigamia maritima TaxID=126957 RepID=T1J2F9_STRMM